MSTTESSNEKKEKPNCQYCSAIVEYPYRLTCNDCSDKDGNCYYCHRYCVRGRICDGCIEKKNQRDRKEKNEIDEAKIEELVLSFNPFK